MVETAQTDTKTTQSLRDAIINHGRNKLTVWQRIHGDEPMPEDMVDKLNESSQDMFDAYLEVFGQRYIRRSECAITTRLLFVTNILFFHF